MKSISISIPKPCHEDWNKMTPNEQGAHCAVCAKTVVDFSKKTDKEIINIFEEKKQEKVCGRFAPSQLSRPVVAFSETDSTHKIIKFVQALLMVFGITLFTGLDANGQTIRGETRVKRVGQVVLAPSKPALTTTNNAPVTKEDVIIERTLGEVAISKKPKTTLKDTAKKETNCTLLKGDTNIAVNVLGFTSVASVAISGDTVVAVENVIDTSKVTKEQIDEAPQIIDLDPIEIEDKIVPMHFMGLMMVETKGVKDIEPVETITETTDSAQTKEPEITEIKKELELVVGPNPSKGEIVLSYELKQNAAVRIDLFDITGKKVKTLTATPNQYAGKYNVTHNVSELPNGVYIINMQAEDKKATARIILAK